MGTRTKSTIPDRGHELSNYNRFPSIEISPEHSLWAGPEVWTRLASEAQTRAGNDVPIVVIDAYPGTDVQSLTAEIQSALHEYQVIDIEGRVAHSSEHLEAMLSRTLTDDRVFGRMDHFDVQDFLDVDKLSELRREVRATDVPTVLVGWGAESVYPEAHVVAVAEVSRWEIQKRQRVGEPNWRAQNPNEDNLRKYKRGFFIEWRTADRHKRRLFDTVDFVLDVNRHQSAVMMTGVGFRATLHRVARQPFRLTPFFDPGVWGGQWMKEKLGLDPREPNYAWCFDCVPEENSLLFRSGEIIMEVPAIDLVLAQPKALLGAKTYARFGAEFPIRFDFLDTMEGENLSLQVHPSTDYIRNTFGMAYTQDESYYILDCDDDAVVYLGLKSPVDVQAVTTALVEAQQGTAPFPAEEFINVLPVKRHDHYSIPAGTVHCSGANSMVLEISATPFIFTFKLWDWGRVGLDGQPRPIHLDHGLKNIDWARDTSWVHDHLAGGAELITETEGVREERTGLHELEFIEVRRHWFDEVATHDTEGTVNVLNLVEGDEVEIVSPTDQFEPFLVHYAETFVIPAAVGPYVIRRTRNASSETFATVKAFVRGTKV